RRRGGAGLPGRARPSRLPDREDLAGRERLSSLGLNYLRLRAPTNLVISTTTTGSSESAAMSAQSLAVGGTVRSARCSTGTYTAASWRRTQTTTAPHSQPFRNTPRDSTDSVVERALKAWNT